MSRLLVVATACVVMWVRTAAADAVDTNIRQLDGGNNYKIRLAAAVALAKSTDARAVIALAKVLGSDSDASIRRVAAVALENMIDARTPQRARELGFAAIDRAAASDRDPRVRGTAARAARALAAIRRKPQVFVNVDATTDQSKQLPSGAGDRLTLLLRKSVESTGYATSWPGGLPTSAELTSSRARAFILAGTVKKIEITRVGSRTQIACTVAVRVAPWMGKDGGERWEANRAASASGSATAMTGNRARDVQGGLRDCVEAVAEDVTSRQVLPFLRQVAKRP